MARCPFVGGGAMMGDYIGPPEGIAADAHTKAVVIRTAFFWFVFCATGESWFVTSQRR